MWSQPLASPRFDEKYPRLCSPSKVMPKSSPCELSGYPGCSMCHVPPTESGLAMNMSRPPMPGCPSDEKYRSPFGLNVGNISSPSVFIGSPRFSTPPTPAAVSLTRQMSSPPIPPGMSLVK